MDDELVDAYDIFAGCEMGTEGQFNQLIKRGVPADEVAVELSALLETYMKERKKGETFKQYYYRMSTATYTI